MAKPTNKDVSQEKSDQPGSGELSNNDLQEVTGGMVINHPTGPTRPTTGPTEPTDPVDPVCISGRL